MCELFARDQVAKIWGAVLNSDSENHEGQQLNASHKIQTIVIYTCVWKRPELTEIVLSYYSYLQKQLAGKIRLELLAVGSEGESSRRLCESCGFDYLEAPNRPLSLKWEQGINVCAEYDPDAVIIVGSDDIISKSMIEFYDKKLKENLIFAGIKDAYFFDVLTESMVYWTGYNTKADTRRVGETTGMGRCLSRCLLDQINFSIWEGLEINKGLDWAMTQKFLELGLHFLDYNNLVLAEVDGKPVKVGHCGFYLTEMDACAIDIKTTENVTSFQRYSERDNRSIIPQEHPWEMMTLYFSVAMVEQLKSFTRKTKKQMMVSYFSQANQLMRDREFEEAVVFYQKAITQCPTFPWYYYNLGQAFVKMERWDEAVVAYRQALEVQSDLPGVEEKLIALLKKEELFNQAQLYSKNKETITSGFYESEDYESLAKNVFSNNLLKLEEKICSNEADDPIQKIKNLNNPDIQKGVVLLKELKCEEAVNHFISFLEKNGESYIISYYLGECFEQLEKWEEAIKAYQKAIQLNPKFVPSYHKCGDVFMKLEQWENAKKQFYQAICALF